MPTLAGLLRSGCEKEFARTALAFFRSGETESCLSFVQLDRDACRMAHFLCSQGIHKGDHVALMMDKSLFFVTAYIAVQKIGAVAIPFNPEYKSSELAYLLKDSNPELLLASAHLEKTIAGACLDVKTMYVDTRVPYEQTDLFKELPSGFDIPELSASDPALIIYTSGTTGNPKGVILSQDNLCSNARTIMEAWQITETDCLLHALPLFHIHGLCFALNTCLIAGSTILLTDRFDAGVVLDLLKNRNREQACSIFMGVPTMYRRLVDGMDGKSVDLGHLRLLAVGSAPLLEKDFERISHAFGSEPVEREGMSETGMNFSNPLNGVKKPGSIGLPLPGLEVRVVDPDTSEDVAVGEIGEFLLKGPNIFQGYLNKPEETIKAFDHGWFRTGDLGRKDADGYYFLTDRLKNIIISGGENISPKEIENVINRLEDVTEVCVVGIKDPQWGEKVVAAIVKKTDAAVTAHDVKEICKTHLHDWKCPKEILFLEQLPKNAMGKILKEKVQEKFLSPA